MESASSIVINSKHLTTIDMLLLLRYNKTRPHDIVTNIRLHVMNWGRCSSSAAQKPTMSLLFPYNLPQLSIPGDHPPCLDPHIPHIFLQSLALPTLLLSLSSKAMVPVISLLSILCTCPAYRNPAAVVLLIISCDPYSCFIS